MAVTNADILGWLNANPNASPELINQTMAEAGVSAAQYQSATGTPPPPVPQATSLQKVVPTPVIVANNNVQTSLLDVPVKEKGGPVRTNPEVPVSSVSVDPLVKLYQDTLGRTPSQAEIDSWNFGSTIDAGELDRFLGAARNEATSTMPTTGAAAKIASQILAQGTTGQWSGQGYGSAEKTAYDMGVMLAGQGITDINQLGIVNKVGDVGVTPKYEYIDSPDGYIQKLIGYVDANGNTYDPSKIIETEDGLIAKNVVTGQSLGDKTTGQSLNTYYDRAASIGPNIWGGTFAGKDSTAYGVKFDAAGKPIFYSQSGGDSSNIADYMPLIQMALLATGAGSALGSALLGSGASAVATGALGGGLLGAGTSALAGGDWRKGALLGGASGALGGYLQGGGPIDASNMTSAQFNDALETQLIKTMQDAGLTTQQIGQWLENASPTDIASVVNTLPVTGASDQLVVEAAKTPITANALTNVLSQVPTITTTGAKTTEQVSPDTLNAVTSILNNNLITTPTVEVKATNPNKSEVPVITPITSTLPVTPPTVEVTATNPNKTEVPVITPITTVPTTVPVTPTTTTTGGTTKDTKLTTSDIIRILGIGTTIAGINAATSGGTGGTTGGGPQYPIVEIPSGWSPATAAKVAPATQLPAIDFGTRNLLKGTQWEKFLDPNYGKVPAPVQFSQPSNLSYSDLMGILGSKQGYPAASNLSINDIISGIQNQYGQAPVSTMG